VVLADAGSVEPVSEQPFELEPDDLPAAPDLPGEVIVNRSIDETLDAFADDLFVHAEAAVEDHGRFDLAVAPHRSLEAVWFRMMLATEYRLFPWAQTHVWLTDPDVAAAARLQETLLWPAGIPIEQVHPMPGRGELTLHERLSEALHERPLDATVLGSVAQDGFGVSQRVFLQADRIAVLAVGQTLEATASLTAELIAAAPRLRWYVGNARPDG